MQKQIECYSWTEEQRLFATVSIPVNGPAAYRAANKGFRGRLDHILLTLNAPAAKCATGKGDQGICSL